MKAINQELGSLKKRRISIEAVSLQPAREIVDDNFWR
jgi:hypothetical protein